MPLPPDARIEAVVRYLLAIGDLRTVIGLVELWAEAGVPTPVARIASARSFLQLGLMERAWARLEPLVESGLGGQEALELTARAFLGRGWPSQARKAVERALVEAPGDPVLAELWDRAVEPATDADPGGVGNENDDDECIAAAVRLIAHGKPHRAEILIERVRRRTPGHIRAADLQWALKGDYGLRGRDLNSLVASYEPFTTVADVMDEPEHTESRVSPDLLHELLDEADGGSPFPTLFRGMPIAPAVREPEEDLEVTSSGALLDLDAETKEPTSGESLQADETQVRVIINRSGSVSSLESLAPFDLARFRADMGVDEEFAPPPEQEDEGLIVHVRRERASTQLSPDPPTAEVTGLGMGTRSDGRGSVPLPAESVDWVRPAAKKTEPTAMPRRPAQAPAAFPAWIVWLVALSLVIATTLGAVWILLLLRLLDVL